MVASAESFFLPLRFVKCFVNAVFMGDRILLGDGKVYLKPDVHDVQMILKVIWSERVSINVKPRVCLFSENSRSILPLD